MCKAASMIVVNGQPPIWSKYSDSHERIRDEFKLPHNTDTLTANVQVEITPPNDNYRAPLKDWVFKVDQDRLPKWWDAKVAETAVRAELKNWAKQKLVLKDCAELRDGQYYILAKVDAFHGIESVILSGGTVSMVYGTVRRVYGTVGVVYSGGTVGVVYGTVSRVYSGGTVSEVYDGGTVGVVYSGGTVGVVYGTVSRVYSGGTVSEVYDGGTIIVYTRLDPACLRSSKAVMIDRSGDKVVIHIGKDE